ncbi:MAG: hypothetical protein B7X37_05005 [Halothiobacillus sp. 14-55-98]|jgi:CHAD domain-containing protein|nr:MAG: hypothetical protein B7X37_05005 [Halothiobacillus sp. 14-55-98]
MSQRIKHIKQLHKPADRVARVIVRNIRKNMLKARRIWLNQAASPSGGQQDSEALHNFRVEIRRLRVWLQQTRDLIRTKTKARMQLKNWAQGSNAGRDLEVMLGLLQQANAEDNLDLPSNSLIEKDKDLIRLISDPALALKPRPRTSSCSRPRMQAQSTKCTPFSAWLADRLHDEREKTLPLLREKDETLHEARIHIKHMRYLIEPIALSELKSTQSALNQLKALQTTLGDLHDLFVLREKLPSLICGLLNERLTARLQQPSTLTDPLNGSQTDPKTGPSKRAIQQDFTAIRNQYTLYLGWQAKQYDHAIESWHTISEQASARLEMVLNDLIGELKNLSK